MLFKQAVLDRIAGGEVRLAFRRWTKPTVSAGGTLRTAIGVLAIEAVDEVAAGSLTEADAAAAGFGSLDALMAALGGHEGKLYRIAFARAGDDPRIALRRIDRLDAGEQAALAARLHAWDARSPSGPWTLQALRLIGSRDGITAAEIAERLGVEKLALKARIRRLKEFGLTESLVAGYRLSPRGRAFLETRQAGT
ncbi:ASCH domain-containing protein [Phreatobacter sp. AB_2022a]|uniref:ASCH domain-containing protein n=1 Tax=Phreatobacter sp. AB_2022a TaxID=3003134 RepID=UPI0022875339|nr:ASCH domain-containing protein [Phreatobacter sp. AB_2022a]MCZ0738808.1 ASCH domain-containing protein [Phreatobacter sp. AB_2022a]